LRIDAQNPRASQLNVGLQERKMNRKYIGRLLYLFLGVIAVSACRLTPPVSVTGAIATRLDQGSTRVIRISDFTDFNWERVFIFEPYTPDAKVEEALKFSYPDVKKFNLSSSDTFWLIVFTKGQRVVRVEQMKLREAVFTLEALNRGLTPNEAIFAVSGKKLSIEKDNDRGQPGPAGGRSLHSRP